jgi:uncharacterized glyoxalase superfamily protein PhnB
MEATLAFYRLLGLDLPETTDEGHVEATTEGGLRLMWDTVDVVRSFSTWEPATGGHRMALAFLCDTPHEVDELFKTVTAAGYQAHLEPFDAFWGQRYATVLDPDGNPVDLFAPLDPAG